MPKYTVIAHRRVHTYLTKLKNEKLKQSIIELVEKLADYPGSLKEMDVKSIKGVQKTFRIRTGRHRIIFYVDKHEKTIYVTHLDTRKRVYKK